MLGWSLAPFKQELRSDGYDGHPPHRLNERRDAALADILGEIGVPRPVLTEARNRRDLVLDIAMEHEAARARYVSGSVAHGTHNRPLEDTDCGIKVDRRVQPFRQFGPDGDGRGPEEFIQAFATFVLPRLRERGYPHAEVDLTGNRALTLAVSEAAKPRKVEVRASGDRTTLEPGAS